jgi:hypothetical protein
MRLTARNQNVSVMTVSTLRDHLHGISTDACRYTVSKAHRDRVSVRADYLSAGKRKHATVLLPAYPTGSADDAPANNLNVVLDPVGFDGARSCEELHVFAPLLGDEIIEHYEKLHPAATVPISRCC